MRRLLHVPTASPLCDSLDIFEWLIVDGILSNRKARLEKAALLRHFMTNLRRLGNVTLWIVSGSWVLKSTYLFIQNCKLICRLPTKPTSSDEKLHKADLMIGDCPIAPSHQTFIPDFFGSRDSGPWPYTKNGFSLNECARSGNLKCSECCFSKSRNCINGNIGRAS